jgi:hypothetical protein
VSYLLRRTDGKGGYVAPAGSPSAYVRNRADARLFKTREEAEAERCVENEIIVRADEARS